MYIIETFPAGGTVVVNLVVSASFPSVISLAAGSQHNHAHAYKFVSQGS